MVPDDVNEVHLFFLGIGGIGMSALARYYNNKGHRISGYDRTCTPLTIALEAEGMDVFYTDSPALMASPPDYVVFTPAINEGQLFTHFKSLGIPMHKRSEVLGRITRGKFTIAVAGTHGKTTVCSMITHLLRSAKRPVTAFLGGISNDLGSNFCFAENAEFLIVEADEFDRSFLTLNPSIAVITSMDPDHLDIYGEASSLREAFLSFVGRVEPNGVLLQKAGLPVARISGKSKSYAQGDLADYRSHITENNGISTVFNLVVGHQRFEDLSMNYPGWHNIENMTAALAACIEAGVAVDELRDGVSSYSGVHRRFEIVIHSPDLVFIDDYAHHPVELNAIITSVRELFPGRHISGIFQPHLFSRTRDFADGFAESLSLLDALYLLDIYPAREKPIAGVDANLILDKVLIKNRKLVTKEQITEEGYFKDKNLQVLLTLGAGDVSDIVKPLKDNLLKEYL
jgi:UDP-N-acetylmuramate--alanine ligase